MNIFEAVENNDLDEINSYLDQGGDIEAKYSEDGETPLYWAAWHNKPEAVDLLLKRNANAKTTTKDGYTPLMYAALFLNKKMMQSLLERGADPYAKTVVGCTPLSLALSNRIEQAAEIIKLLRQPKLKSLVKPYARGIEHAKKMMTKMGKKIPSGEWDNEPDCLEFIDGETNIWCLIIRNGYGALSGYIEVPKEFISKYDDHLEYNLRSKIVLDTGKIALETVINWYGDPSRGSNVWVSFHCMQVGQFVPFALDNCEKPINYKNIKYVINECQNVAMQLYNMAKEEVTK